MSDDRYSRQSRLAEIGAAGQARIRAARVLVVGAGGLGLPAAAYLAGAGVGRITLVDHDQVELHNLQRQVFYRECDVGEPKVAAAAAHLRALNSEVAVVARPERLRDANAAVLVAEHDVVLDAADNFSTTYLLSDTCHELGVYLVSAAMLGNSGHLGVFCRDAPSYRALFPHAPEGAGNCARTGVLGSAVGALGVMQAQEALKLLVSPEHALVGKLLTADFWHNRFSTLDFSAAAEPAGAVRIPLLAAQELREGDLLVDVRSAAEVAAAPVEGALHLPAGESADDFAAIPASPGRTVFFCVSGLRAEQAARRFSQSRAGADAAVVVF